MPDDLAAPVGAPAQQAARLILFNNWIGGNINGTERNIAQQFGAPGGPAPAAANLAPIATQNTSAAIGHDGGGFGFTLQAFIAANIPPPLYLSAWLWNRGQAWSPQLNERFVFDVLNTAAITDVHLVSPYFVGILNGVGVNNLAAQRVAMNGAGNAQVAREIRQLINAGVLSFTWNGATLHQVHVPPRLTRPLATEYTPRNTTPAPLCKRKSGRCVWIQLCKEYTTHASIADACCRSHVPAGSA
ncbi:MAG TPA: hypothetical protein PKC19_20905 [Roseiflexaceae bacterium]|nr:hypothetical protein [Roseiflexaceae bacterium]